MASRWSDEILDSLAPRVSYEMRVAVSQLEILVKKYGDQIPEGYQGAHEDAVLEASLMHLRSLDDFFRGGSGRAPGRPPDMRASDWLKNWEAQLWLDPRVRSRIEWQVVHLSTMRGIEFPPWQLPRYGAALCDEIERFFVAIEKECPDRLPAFEHLPRQIARDTAAVFSKYV
jgi:hypothetical protein